MPLTFLLCGPLRTAPPRQSGQPACSDPASRNRSLKDNEVPMRRRSFDRGRMSVVLAAAIAALVALAAMLVANPAQAATSGALRGVAMRPVSRCAELQPDRRHLPADLGLLGWDQPAVDGDGQQPADRVRQQVPRCSGTRHHGRYPCADLELQRGREPAVARELRRHDRRCGVRTVPGRHGLRYGQRHGSGDLDLQRRQQPEVDRPDRDPGRWQLRSAVVVPVDVDGSVGAAA